MASYEEDVEMPQQSSSPVVPWAVAIVAIALGALAAFHFSSQRDAVFSQVKKYQDEANQAKAKLANVEQAKNNLDQQIIDLQGQVKTLQTAKSDLTAKNEDLNRQLAQAAAPAAPAGKGGKAAKAGKTGKAGKQRRR